MAKTTKIGMGDYQTTDVFDQYGEPYTIERCSWSNASTTGINSPRPMWVVLDSKRNDIGYYPTLKDAKASL